MRKVRGEGRPPPNGFVFQLLRDDRPTSARPLSWKKFLKSAFDRAKRCFLWGSL
jgi:hypothetical protein